jgi:hypothetical protein
MDPYREHQGSKRALPRRTSAFRMIVWLARDGARRLLFARVRREAARGDPSRARGMLPPCERAAASRAFTHAMQRPHGTAEETLRALLTRACTVCGARWSEPCDGGLHG